MIGTKITAIKEYLYVRHSHLAARHSSFYLSLFLSISICLSISVSLHFVIVCRYASRGCSITLFLWFLLCYSFFVRNMINFMIVAWEQMHPCIWRAFTTASFARRPGFLRLALDPTRLLCGMSVISMVNVTRQRSAIQILRVQILICEFQNFARTHSPTRLMSSENTYSLSREHCNLKYSGMLSTKIRFAASSCSLHYALSFENFAPSSNIELAVSVSFNISPIFFQLLKLE